MTKRRRGQLGPRERERRAINRTIEQERKQKMPEQNQQLEVLAEVTISFRPEFHKTYGAKEKTFTQVGVTQQGPFMKMVPAPGSNLGNKQELFHFDTIAGLVLTPAQIRVSAEMPPPKVN